MIAKAEVPIDNVHWGNIHWIKNVPEIQRLITQGAWPLGFDIMLLEVLGCQVPLRLTRNGEN